MNISGLITLSNLFLVYIIMFTLKNLSYYI